MVGYNNQYILSSFIFGKIIKIISKKVYAVNFISILINFLLYIYILDNYHNHNLSFKKNYHIKIAYFKDK